MNLTQQQKQTNIASLRFLTFANFGYVLAIPVMVDYVNNHATGGSESYFYIITITNALSIILAPFIGAYSDFYSRRAMLVTSMFCKILAWLLFLIFPGFEAFTIGFALLLVGVDMCNTSACLFETMTAAGNQRDYRKEEQKIYAYPQYALMIGLPVSGFLYAANPAWPFILNIVIAAIGIIAACYYTEAPRKKTNHTNPLALLKDALLFLKNTSRLRWLTLYKGIILAMMSIMIFVFQARFLEIGGSVTTFSIIITAVYLIRGISAQQAERLFRYTSHPINALAFILVGSCIVLFLTGISTSLWVFTTFMLIYMIFRGLQKPCLNFIHNDLLSSDKRATAFAASSLSARFGKVIFNLIAGITIASFGANVTLVLISFAAAIIGGLLLWLLKRTY